MEKVTAVLGKENYQTNMIADNLAFLSDLPPEMGGKQTGPKPTQLLASALAGCIAMTVRIYADRNKWALDEVIVNVEYDVESKPGTTVFRENVSFTGDLNEKQLQRLHVIAGKCPIRKALLQPIELRSF